MIKKIIFIAILCLSISLCFDFIGGVEEAEEVNAKISDSDKENKKIIIDDPFIDTFDKNEILEESGNMDESSNDYWWVNSGAFLIQENGISRTLFGALEEDSKWQIKYRNGRNDIPEETDGGFYPQNIFRLITRSKWENFQQEAYFKLAKYNLSESKYRSESNGLVLFSRYEDQYNLYYAGIRVDGTAVVKKKINKEYYTMAQEKIFDGEYDKNINPNLLPIDKWIGIRNEVKTVDNDQVEIKVFIDRENSGNWELVLDIKDDGKSYGGRAILGEAYAGIRTDFMDVGFDNYRIETIKNGLSPLNIVKPTVKP